MRRAIDLLRGRRPETGVPLPTGTITFMLTDVEGSVRLWEAHPDTMRDAIARHTEIIGNSVTRHGGTLVRERGEGDSTFSVFTSGPSAVAAALDMQRTLLREDLPSGIDLLVRIALHTGDGRVVDDEYAAPAINRCARIREVASGGQVLLSEQTAELTQPVLPNGSHLQDLGPHRLRDLSRPMRIFQLAHPDLLSSFPPLRSLEAVLHNLPVQLTTFIGREREITEIRKHLASSRILNLTGPGGVGKTRLALHVAAQLIETYSDGVWFVDLSALTDAELLPQAISRALSLREQPERETADAIADHLRGAHALLILDNCEHVIDPASRFATALLRECVELTILATGREPLKVPGATTWPLPAMEVPGPDEAVMTEAAAEYEGVRLFCERAALVRPDFALTHETAPTVARICQKLDGLPLAIELAAAAVRSMTPAEIDARLDDRFRILTGGGPDVPRHETLQATVDWSHELLSAEEQVVFRRLGVFVGGFTLEGAEAVCSGDGIDASDVVALVASLVGKSLIVAEEFGDATRYYMLETIRTYAADRLTASSEGDSLREKHLVYYEDLAQRLGSQRGQDLAAGLDALEADHDNLRQALTVAEGTRALVMATNLTQFWLVRGHWSEGRWRFEGALRAAPDEHSPQLAAALHSSGRIAFARNELAEAESYHRRGLEMHRELGDQALTMTSLVSLGGALHARGERTEARELFEEALALAREHGNERQLVQALNGVAMAAHSSGDFQAAIDAYEEAIRLTKSRLEVAPLSLNLAWANRALGRFEDARRAYEGALEIAREIDDRRLIARTLREFGRLAETQNNLEEARSKYVESLDLSRTTGDKQGIADGLYVLAEITRREGRPAEALDLLDESRRLFEEIGLKQGIAGTLHELGLTKRALGDIDAAKSMLETSIRMVEEIDFKEGLAACLDAIAGLRCESRDFHAAAMLIGAADTVRAQTHEVLTENATKERERDIELIRSNIDTETMERAIQAGRALSTTKAVALALERT